MVLLGKQVTQVQDVLTEISTEALSLIIRDGGMGIASLQERLRIIQSVDPNAYRKLKTGLPYMVCAAFHPRVRRKENFLQATRFLVDLDHLAAHELEIDRLRQTLKLDPRIELMFISPGADGLKLMFQLSRPIQDAAYYSQFYKAFCLSFKMQYQLGAALDVRTHDVTRCCFLAHDPEVYYNPVCERMEAEKYLAAENFAALDALQRELKEDEQAHESIPEKVERVLDEDVLNAIRLKVGVRVKQAREKHYEQPEQLKEMMPRLVDALEKAGLQVSRNEPIHYGRQIQVKAENGIWAEVNVFYGKRGPSIVGTSKSGSHAALRELLVDLLRNLFQ